MPPRSPLTHGRLVAALAVIVAITALVAPIAAEAQTDPETTTVALGEIGDSGVSGVATLESDGDQTSLMVRLTGAFDDHVIGIASQSCANLDAPQPDLEGMAWVTDPDGFADTVIPLPFDQLVDSDHSITVRRSEAQRDELIACGDIGGATSQIMENGAGTDTDTEGNDVARTDSSVPADLNGMPTTGIGSASQTDFRLAVVIAGLATLAAAIAISTARRPGLGSR